MSNTQLAERKTKRILTQRFGKNDSNLVMGLNLIRLNQFGLDFLCIELLHWSEYIDAVTMNQDKKLTVAKSHNYN